MQVIDDFLPKEDFEYLKEIFLSDYFPWYVQKDISIQDDWFDNKNSYMLTHGVYKDNVPNSKWFDDINDILLSKVNSIIKVNSILRIKLNHYPSSNTIVKHKMHYDFDFNHNALLYSLNDCDGYTYFEDGSKVQSKANRIILFDASVPHCSTNCTDSKYRININANWL